jgi:hypothetical protein
MDQSPSIRWQCFRRHLFAIHQSKQRYGCEFASFSAPMRWWPDETLSIIGRTRASQWNTSTATTPNGMPPNLARPVTTVLPHSPILSRNVPRSKNPLCHLPLTLTPGREWNERSLQAAFQQDATLSKAQNRIDGHGIMRVNAHTSEHLADVIGACLRRKCDIAEGRVMRRGLHRQGRASPVGDVRQPPQQRQLPYRMGQGQWRSDNT